MVNCISLTETVKYQLSFCKTSRTQQNKQTKTSPVTSYLTRCRQVSKILSRDTQTWGMSRDSRVRLQSPDCMQYGWQQRSQRLLAGRKTEETDEFYK